MNGLLTEVLGAFLSRVTIVDCRCCRPAAGQQREPKSSVSLRDEPVQEAARCYSKTADARRATASPAVELRPSHKGLDARPGQAPRQTAPGADHVNKKQRTRKPAVVVNPEELARKAKVSTILRSQRRTRSWCHNHP